MSFDMNKLMQQDAEMQKQVEQMQADAEHEIGEASVGGGMVKVTANGAGQVLTIAISPEAVDPSDVEGLQDLVLAGVNEALYAHVDDPTNPEYSAAEGLAIEYAERYATDHHNLDDEFWKRMSSQYTQKEIVELSMSLGAWLAFGRLNHVLGLDTVCVLPSHRAETTGASLRAGGSATRTP